MCYQTQKGLWNFSKTSSSQHYPYSPPFFQNYYKHPFYSPFLYHLPRITIFFLLKKVMGINVFQDLNPELSSKKEKSKWSEFALLKKRRRKWTKIPTRWPMEGSNVWWLMEGKRKKHLFTSSHFPLKKFYLNLHFFPLILRFYFTMF